MNKIFLTLPLMITLLLSSQPSGSSPISPKDQSFGQAFDIKASPTAGDWQRFHILSNKEQQRLWQFHRGKGLLLRDWAWQWRLAWLRACGKPEGITACTEILTSGLEDPALVVRAEAATQFAAAKRDKVTTQDIALLAKAYERKDNSRGTKNLYVCERILDALASFDHPEARKTASRLARKNKGSNAYWQARVKSGSKAAVEKL